MKMQKLMRIETCRPIFKPSINIIEKFGFYFFSFTFVHLVIVTVKVIYVLQWFPFCSPVVTGVNFLF